MSIELLKKFRGEEFSALLMFPNTRATNLIFIETYRIFDTCALSLLIPEVAFELHNRSGAEGAFLYTEGGIAVVLGKLGVYSDLLQRIRMHTLASGSSCF